MHNQQQTNPNQKKARSKLHSANHHWKSSHTTALCFKHESKKLVNPNDATNVDDMHTL